MDSLIGHLARKHRLGKENLATEVLVYILESSDVVVVQRLLRSYGVIGDWGSYGYQFTLQKRAAGGRGIQDVRIEDAAGEIRAFIESKFDASLTDKQPLEYLDMLPSRGVLLFIVPERRTRVLFEKLAETCRSSPNYAQVVKNSQNRTCRLPNGKKMVVTSWEDFLRRLANYLSRSKQLTEEQRRRGSDIEQLRRLCDMAKEELFEPLTADQIRGVGISPVIRQLKWITKEVINQCVNRRIVQEMSKGKRQGGKNVLRADANDTSLCYGQNLRFCGMDIWIGFWSEVWEQQGFTPLWVCVYRQPRATGFVSRVQRVNGSSAVRKHSDGWLIPLGIKSKRYQEDVVEDVIRRLSELRDIAREMTTAGRNALDKRP